jgi:hypothetical protein
MNATQVRKHADHTSTRDELAVHALDAREGEDFDRVYIGHHGAGGRADLYRVPAGRGEEITRAARPLVMLRSCKL